MSYNRKELVDWVRGIYQNLNKADKQDALRFFPELRGSEDEKIRQHCQEWEHNPERRTIPADIGNIKQIRKYLEKQKESLHVQETYKENADSFTSEDERVRKEIIDFLETIPASELKRIPRPINKWFTWLEKQKESNIPWYDYQKSKEAGYTIVPNEEYEQLIKQKEQNPAWSEEDTLMLTAVTQTLENFGPYGTIGMQIDWLKSLRPSWKPSEKQMNCLCAAVDAAIRKHNESVSGYEPARVLKSLYEQLQKL